MLLDFLGLVREEVYVIQGCTIAGVGCLGSQRVRSLDLHLVRVDVVVLRIGGHLQGFRVVAELQVLAVGREAEPSIALPVLLDIGVQTVLATLRHLRVALKTVSLFPEAKGSPPGRKTRLLLIAGLAATNIYQSGTWNGGSRTWEPC